MCNLVLGISSCTLPEGSLKPLYHILPSSLVSKLFKSVFNAKHRNIALQLNMRNELANKLLLQAFIYWLTYYSNFWSTNIWNSIDYFLRPRHDYHQGIDEYEVVKLWNKAQFIVLYIPRMMFRLFGYTTFTLGIVLLVRDLTRPSTDINVTDGVMIGRFVPPLSNLLLFSFQIKLFHYLLMTRSVVFIGYCSLHWYFTHNNIYVVSSILEIIPTNLLIIWNSMIFIVLIPFSWIPYWSFVQNHFYNSTNLVSFIKGISSLYTAQLFKIYIKQSFRNFRHSWNQRRKFVCIQKAVAYWNERIFEAEFTGGVSNFIEMDDIRTMRQRLYFERSGTMMLHHILKSTNDIFTIKVFKSFHARVSYFNNQITQGCKTEFKPIYSPEELEYKFKTFRHPIVCLSYKHTRRGNEDIDGLLRDKERVSRCLEKLCERFSLNGIFFWCDLVYPSSTNDIVSSSRRLPWAQEGIDPYIILPTVRIVSKRLQEEIDDSFWMCVEKAASDTHGGFFTYNEDEDIEDVLLNETTTNEISLPAITSIAEVKCLVSSLICNPLLYYKKARCSEDKEKVLHYALRNAMREIEHSERNHGEHATEQEGIHVEDTQIDQLLKLIHISNTMGFRFENIKRSTSSYVDGWKGVSSFHPSFLLLPTHLRDELDETFRTSGTKVQQLENLVDGLSQIVCQPDFGTTWCTTLVLLVQDFREINEAVYGKVIKFRVASQDEEEFLRSSTQHTFKLVNFN